MRCLGGRPTTGGAVRGGPPSAVLSGSLKAAAAMRARSPGPNDFSVGAGAVCSAGSGTSTQDASKPLPKRGPAGRKRSVRPLVPKRNASPCSSGPRGGSRPPASHSAPSAITVCGMERCRRSSTSSSGGSVRCRTAGGAWKRGPPGGPMAMPLVVLQLGLVVPLLRLECVDGAEGEGGPAPDTTPPPQGAPVAVVAAPTPRSRQRRRPPKSLARPSFFSRSASTRQNASRISL